MVFLGSYWSGMDASSAKGVPVCHGQTDSLSSAFWGPLEEERRGKPKKVSRTEQKSVQPAEGRNISQLNDAFPAEGRGQDPNLT